jgi:recombination protein RecR
LCGICQDPKRDHHIITIVEDVLDLLSFETGNIYEGVYHVLHGRIDPLNRVGPDDIYIPKLLDRVDSSFTDNPIDKDSAGGIKELILATNPDMEGEATAMFIRTKLQEMKDRQHYDFAITRLGYGLPIGANLEYADYMTLRKAIENRNKY